MEIFKIAEYVRKANPETGNRHTERLLEKKAENLSGLFSVIPPGGQTPYHFHNKRESVIIIVSGQGMEVVEGAKIPIQAGDVLFIPSKQKHCMENGSTGELRYLEFQAGNPNEADLVQVERNSTEKSRPTRVT